MRSLLKSILKPLFYYLKSRKHRVYHRLSSAYSADERYTKRTMRILDYTIEASDSISVVHQFKEMFIDEAYKFKSSKKAPLIYDCGANIGLSCLYFKTLYPNCTIKAFEADPQIYSLLKKNIENNVGSKDIELINKAVWIDDGGVEFNQEGADGGTVRTDGLENGRTLKIESIRLKNLLENERPDFLKMDIEGAEMDVLIDCGGVLSNVQTIFVEYHSYAGKPQKLNILLSLFQENGFRYFIQSPIEFKSPFDLPWVGLDFDLQLNIYCYRL